VLQPAIVRANARLTLDKRPLIPAGVKPHLLRHTYCSLLIAQGEELPTMAAQMRHADISTTLRVYTHVMKQLEARFRSTKRDLSSAPGRIRTCDFCLRSSAWRPD
jgi:integrase